MKYEATGNKTIVGRQETSQIEATRISGSIAPEAGRVSRVLVFTYGLVAYVICLGTFVYAFGFIGNYGVPKAMDSGRENSLAQALLIDALLLGVFAVQHSVMARPWFKEWWTRFVPKIAERSTYVLVSCVLMFVLFWQWQPIGGTIWDVQNSIGRGLLFGLYVVGWIVLLTATFLINHFDLFGLRQVFLFLRGKDVKPLKFATPALYKYVRHPLYVGWFLTFWATPTMTAAHLVFAVLSSAYILVAIQFEERDLITVHGERYAQYRRSVPMLIPRLFSRQPESRRTVSDSTTA
jgi:protein-S-isoprenylcysteine O-methyltransferase Ste14